MTVPLETPTNGLMNALRDAAGIEARGARVTLASNSGNLNFTTETAIDFDTEDADTDGFHEGVTNPSRLTVPPGLGITHVAISGTVRLGSVSDDYVWLTLRQSSSIGTLKTNHRLVMKRHVGESNCAGSISDVFVPVADGDYFELKVHTPADTTTIIVANGTYFSIQVVGLDVA